MRQELTREELALRMHNFRIAMDKKNPDWETAVL